MAATGNLLAAVDSRSSRLEGLSRQIWHLAEPALQEQQSARLLADALEQEGFRVERGTGGVATAFVAEYGSGSPVLGILGEYDALPELSQRASPQRDPVVRGGPGHGCGHNLLGTAAVGAALALKDAIAAGTCGGTIRFYGCPAEELLLGKVLLAASGAFDDLDACLTWHPGTVNSVWGGSSLALNSALFTFHGVTSHAAASPDAGRSALDAVELMNVGANYLREHVRPEARIHYVITEGGSEPNVVPSRAQAWYYVRGPRRADVESIYGRLLDVARGACLMTGTTHEVELKAACYDFLPNRHLSRLVWEQLQQLGAPPFDAEDETMARQLAETLDQERVQAALGEIGDPQQTSLLHHAVQPWRDPAEMGHVPGSTDVGDVSYLVPTAQFTMACAPLGVAGHTWQYTAAAGSTVGHKAMIQAAKVMALAGFRLLSSQADIDLARAEFAEATRAQPYRSPLAGTNMES